ncbi:MAG: molybdopterin-binding protein [Opitutaceae bacterium]
MQLRSIVCLSGLLLSVTAAQVQSADRVLHLRYGDKKIVIAPADFEKLKPSEVEAADDDGRHRFRGVAIHDLLHLVGAPPGDRLRRPTLCLVVRIKGADGLVCAFALAEFEEGFTDRTIILASHQDGAPLRGDVGPWRVIAPKDTRFARWVRQAVSIEVISIENDAGSGDASQPEKAAVRANEHIKFAPAK